MEGWLLLSSTSGAPALPLPTVAYRAADFAVEYESKEGDGIPDAADSNRRSTVLEEVNDNDVAMEPLHYPVVTVVAVLLPPMAGASEDGQICAAEGAAGGGRGNRKLLNNLLVR